MDAAVKPRDRSGKTARTGRIIVVRHGRPALDRNAGPRLDWRAYRDWWASYEQASLADGQKCPETLLKEVPDNAIMLSSVRPRAKQTAAQIARGLDVKHDPMFNEATLPPPRWKRKFLPKTWNMISRIAWMMGHAEEGDENSKQAKARAVIAAQTLVETAEAGGGRDVVLAAHGWFNRMLRPELRKRGWKCVHNGGDKYWSYRIYRKR